MRMARSTHGISPLAARYVPLLRGALLLALVPGLLACKDTQVPTPTPATGGSTLSSAANAASLRLAAMAAIQRDAPAAYRLAVAGDGARAKNPAHGFEARFSGGAVGLSSSKDGWKLDLRLQGFGYEGAVRAAAAGRRVVSGNRLELRREALTEWYVNGPLGLEQGFTVPAPPAGKRPRGAALVLRMKMTGDLSPRPGKGLASVALLSRGGRALLYVTELYAHDSTGRMLPATFSAGASSLAIHVDDRQAVYPVTIDPLFTTEIKVTAGDAAGGDEFGRAVAINGDTAVVGSPYDDDKGSKSGAAYVFTRSGSTWSQAAKLVPTTLLANDWFGYSVAISGGTVVVGAPLNDTAVSGAGAAFVYTGSGTTWTHQATLTASDATTGDNLGVSVSIDGGTVVAGAHLKSVKAGAAYVFTGSGATWTQQQKLTAASPATNDYFGRIVDVDSDTVVVGCWGDDDLGSSSGTAYVFTRSGTTWSQQQKLTAGDGAAGDRFGAHVAVDSDTVVVGSYMADDTVAGADAGAAYVYSRSGTTWTQQQKLTASDKASGELFGLSVALSGDTDIVGAPCDDGAGTDAASTDGSS